MSVENYSEIKEQILNSLDMNPMSMRQLRDVLEIKSGTRKHFIYMHVMSILQKRMKPPLLGISINRNLEESKGATYHPDTFVIYRTDQANVLEEAGKLSAPEERPTIYTSEILYKQITNLKNEDF